MSDDGRCGTCDHWRPYEGLPIEDEWEPRGGGWGWCELLEGPGFQDDRQRIAYTMDGSGYEANLICRAEFGCVLHHRAERDVDG